MNAHMNIYLFCCRPQVRDERCTTESEAVTTGSTESIVLDTSDARIDTSEVRTFIESDEDDDAYLKSFRWKLGWFFLHNLYVYIHSACPLSQMLQMRPATSRSPMRTGSRRSLQLHHQPIHPKQGKFHSTAL